MSIKFPTGVITGNSVIELFDYAKEYNFAIPAINVFNSNTINSALESSSEAKSPIILQFSNSGSIFNSGKSLNNDFQRAAILGSIVGAKHIHELAKAYKATVILHTDHCYKNIISWLDGLISINEEYYKIYKKTLFSSHMLDLSSENIKNNLDICSKYLERMSLLNMILEIELGITGGEEDGIDNINIDNNKLYTNPKDVSYAYNRLIKISKNFIIAASFGNVHGVYNPGNINLRPKILLNSQEYIYKKYNTSKNPIYFVFHGGSGSSYEEIKESISYGVVKINLDTDLQYAFMTGIRDYMNKNKDFLKNQVGNSKNKNFPNKKFYDPRIWLREGEKNFKNYLINTFKKVNSFNVLK